VNKRSNHNKPACHSVHAANKKENKMKVTTSRKSGFTLVEIMIVVAIIGLLAAIAIPNFVRARNTAQKNTCINNLRQIDGAKQQWALEGKKSDTDVPTAAMVEVYIKNNKFPTCPAGTTAYVINAVNTDPTCAVNTTEHVLPNP
jgi:prepilin-type N-terminal cleavage/methylation domain-containing protein